MHPSGAENYDALDDCYTSQCNGQCNGYPVCKSGFVTFDQQCSNCLTNTCCSEYEACFKDAACQQCLLGFDAECGKSTLDEPAKDCETKNCQKECGSQ